MGRRSAFTLVETLVVIAILGALMALLLPVIQTVRESALRIQSMNNMRQICLASHHFADVHSGNLPTLDGTRNPGFQSLFVVIMPYLEQDNLYEAFLRNTGGGFSSRFNVPVYLSPADPSSDASNSHGRSNYAANAQVFAVYPRMPQTFADGTSSTIAFAEHYAKCNTTVFQWYATTPVVTPELSIHRSTFADNGPLVLSTHAGQPSDFQDVYPITTGQLLTSTGSIEGLTFQTRPKPNQCDPRIAQSPHRGGMIVGLGDGSVRTISASISARTYWAAVTPAGGEVLGSDW
jgi:prepilin-type N-terminal cleavage/methylation domain-containing protein